jgi:MFS transporter, CP family, cyanate transporter
VIAIDSPPTRSRTRTVWLVIGIGLLALNQRPAVVAVAPLTSRVRAGTGLSSAGVSLLTTLPVLCFGVFAFIGPRLGRRLGLERALGVAIVTLTAGIALRLAPGVPALFAGSAIAGAGIAIENVLLSGLVKRDFAHRTGPMMAVYMLGLSGGATAAAGLTVPIGHGLHAGWRVTLASWGILAALGAIAWLPIALRDRTAGTPGAAPRLAAAVWRAPLAWWIAGFMATQSLAFYSLTAWLPSLLQDHGVSASTAGAMLAVFNFIGTGSALVVPSLATRTRSQHGLAALVAGGYAIGIAGLLIAGHGSIDWLWMVLLGVAQGAGISLGLTMFVLRTRSTAAAAELSGMAQAVGYLVAALGPLSVGALHGATGGWNAGLIELLAVTAVMLVAAWRSADDRLLDTPAA